MFVRYGNTTDSRSSIPVQKEKNKNKHNQVSQNLVKWGG